MMRYGYSKPLACGVIAASGTLAQIIPPSLVLIIMADQLGRSVGDMYAGAFIPGIVLACIYAGFVVLVAIFKPAMVPALPVEARTIREPDGSAGLPSLGVLMAISVVAAVMLGRFYKPGEAPLDELIVVSASIGVAVAFSAAVANHVLKLGLLSRIAERVTFVLIPPLALIFLVLGTIFMGIATPTEGGAMGASGALAMALARRRISFKLLRQAMDSTARLTSFVVFILVGARVFSLTFYGVNGHVWVEELLLNLPGGQLGFLIVVNILVFLLAFFLDFFELSFIVVPLLGPVAEKLGIDLIWFGVLLGVNMQTSFMHPPFGFALFYLRSVAPAKEYVDKLTRKLTPPVTTGQIYWGAVPFVVIQCIMIGLVIVFPQMVMVYKSDKPLVDPNSIRIDIPTQDGIEPPAAGSAEEVKAEGAGNDDLMKSLGGKSDAPGAPEPKEESANDDLMKALGGKPASPEPAAKDAAKGAAGPGAPPKDKPAGK
jgi:tripartite ATP-independent transporter DctM subunit